MRASNVEGDQLRPITFPAITRAQLALFAGGSGDHNPMHIDSDFAKTSGLNDVFAHGMLVMALMSRAVTDWFAPWALAGATARFTSMTQIGDELICTGAIAKVEGEIAVVPIRVTNQSGEVRMTAEAQIRMPGFAA